MSLFQILSGFGILVGLFMVVHGMFIGKELGVFLTVLIGFFVTVKEIMDIFFAN